VSALDLLCYPATAMGCSDVLNIVGVDRGVAGVWVRVPVDFPLSLHALMEAAGRGNLRFGF